MVHESIFNNGQKQKRISETTQNGTTKHKNKHKNKLTEEKSTYDTFPQARSRT